MTPTPPLIANGQPNRGRLLLRVYGDSLSMPRAEEGIAYPDSYPELLRDGLAEVTGDTVDLYNRSYGGAPIDQLKQACEYDALYIVAAAGSSVVLIDAFRAVSEGGIDRLINAKDGHHLTPAGHMLYRDLVLAHEHDRLAPSGPGRRADAVGAGAR